MMRRFGVYIVRAPTQLSMPESQGGVIRKLKLRESTERNRRSPKKKQEKKFCAWSLHSVFVRGKKSGSRSSGTVFILRVLACEAWLCERRGGAVDWLADSTSASH
jgi:hypothetical protein